MPLNTIILERGKSQTARKAAVHMNSSPQVVGVDSCHHLSLGNFLSDHQLLHSWDFHDVLCRFGNRVNSERVLRRQNWARAGTDHEHGDVQDSSSLPLSRYVSQSGIGNCRSLSAVAHVTCCQNCFAQTNCVDKNVNSEFIVECVMRATENGKRKNTHTKLSNIRVGL